MKRVPSSLYACCLALGATLIVSLPACSPSSGSGSFVAKIGDDTLAVESYSHEGSTLSGASVVLSPRTTIRRFTATYDANGALQTFHLTSQPYGEDVSSEATYTYFDDSVQVTTSRNGITRSYTAAVTGRPYPFFENVFAGWEASFRKGMSKEGAVIPILAGRGTLDYAVQKNADGTVDLMNSDFGPMHVTPTPDGDFNVFDMRATTDKYLVTRSGPIDVDAMAASFSAKEKASSPMGALSPRDTAAATIGRAHILVDYGRPSARGRKVFGNIVPFGEVWRTGANQATQLVTDRTLMFGKTAIEPGTYSVFTVPTESGWSFIINKQHGQWGTVYDEAQDIARLPMTVTTLPDAVEQFSIAIDPNGQNGTISLSWENTNATIGFGVR